MIKKFFDLLFVLCRLIICLLIFLKFEYGEGHMNCFETYKDGPLTVFEFSSLIDKILISDEYLIVTGLNDVYLLQQYDLSNCLSKEKIYNKSRPGLEPQNRNKILLEIDKDLKKFLICNSMIYEGCTLFNLEHGSIRMLDKSFNFNANFHLKSCLISKLSHEKNFMIACEPNKRNQKEHLIMGKMRFDEEKKLFQIIKFGDKKSKVSLDGKEMDKMKIDLIYDFDQLMIGSKDRFYYANIVKREQIIGQNLVSKLARVCLGDHSFRSYSEMYLNCVDPETGESYDYAQSAHLGYANSNLHKDTLYITFNRYDESTRSVIESKGSLLCAFDGELIDRSYSEAIRKCNFGNSFERESVRLMNQYHLTDRPLSDRCNSSNESFDESLLSCPRNAKNAYIDYRTKVKGEYLYKFKNEIISSLSSFLFRTDYSEIKKGVVLVTNRSKIYRLIRDKDLMRLEHEFQFNHNVTLKQIESFASKDSIYFTIGHVMIKYPLNLANNTISGENHYNSRRKGFRHKSSKVFKTSFSKNFGLNFIIITLLISILIAIAIYISYKKFRTKKVKKIELTENGAEKVFLRPRPIIVDKTEEMLAKNNILIHESYLKTFEKIGSGFFGQVYRGQLNVPAKDAIEVAIKTLNDLSVEGNEMSNASKSLLNEAFIMKDFKHENILTLVGVCIHHNCLPKIVLPFMSKGSLINFIRSEQNLLTIRNLLNFAIDIGKGMSYLSSQRYVHRDLAARNCMLDENLIVKIGDFGLSRDVYERNYYISNAKSGLPIKWMAPESIEKCVVTSESDVWSFGVVIWELMTRGNIPYAALENYRILEYLRENKRLPKPTTCYDEIYELMLDCWQMIPSFRPGFDTIVRRIRTIILVKEIELDIESGLMVNYANFPIEQYYSTKNEGRQMSVLSSGYSSGLSSYEKMEEEKLTNLDRVSDLDNVIEIPGKQI